MRDVDVALGVATGTRVAWLISYTPAPDEPRLIRQAQTLIENGWRVVVCGYEGRSAPPAAWTFLNLAKPGPGEDGGRPMALRRRVGHRLVRMGVREGGMLYYAGVPDWRRHHQDIMRAAHENPGFKPSLVIAHDYPACPSADALARVYGAAIVVDSHEYMLGARPEDPDWVSHERPIIKAIQDKFFARADQVITVSEGIVDRLNAEQKMKRPARLIRNMPLYQEHRFRPTKKDWTLLYHGIIDPVRNLEPAIEAAALWTVPARMVLRGPCTPEYAKHLRGLIAARNVEHRVTLEEPVPYGDMIARANDADVGYFVYADGSPQRRYTLPNKFFEYVMAGLALCISDLPEMARLSERYGLGVTVPGIDPHTIAQAIDRITPAQIDEFKQASVAAARELCWEHEQTRLIEIVRDLCGTA